MDLQPHHHPEATSSSSHSSLSHIQDQLQERLTSLSSPETRTIRSSARVKAAKQKEKEKGRERESVEQSTASLTTSESTISRIARSNTSSTTPKRFLDSSPNKEENTDQLQSRASKRIRRAISSSVTSPLIINEPARDSKGKKRAAPETNFDEEPSLPSTSAKRLRTTSYPLRSKGERTLSRSSEMPKKTRSSITEAKATMKTKALTSSGTSRRQAEDVDMVDAEYHEDGSEAENAVEPQVEEVETDDRSDGDGHSQGQGDGGGGEGTAEDDSGSRSADVNGVVSGGTDGPAAMAIFGDYHQFGSYMLSLSSRLKTMLNNIKPTADPTTRLVTLQELSELLSISTEDTLAGSFQVELFVKELIKILGGRGVDGDDEEDADDDQAERDGDAALATALALSTGGTAYQGDDNLEAQVLACRCLANLMEALPGVAHTVVYHGAIPVLCSKLIEISYIDLAEQTLSTLEKISEEFPSSIVREGGLAALLNYLDFFSIAVQRTALQAASNCCRNVSVEHFAMIHGVWPIIRNCLAYSDQRLVEFACLCVIRSVDSYHRSASENLELLVDSNLIRAVNTLLLPAGGSPSIAANTYTLLLRALATSARASPKIALALLEADIVDTLYQILTGVLPPSELGKESGSANGGQGLGGSMNVMETLAHRPKDQVEEALSLLSELMPPLPKDGVFDHKAYTEKSLSKMIKTRAKVERAATRQATTSHTSTTPHPPEAVTQEHPSDPVSALETKPPDGDENVPQPVAKELASDRTELLRSKPAVVGRFIQLMVPILIDVYAATVITPVRVKTLTALLKAVSFLDGDGLRTALALVPIAAFASSILSSKDHPSLVIGSLQLVDLLMAKVPAEYKPAFRREGVFHEIEALASREVTSSKAKDKDKESSDAPTPEPASTPVVPLLSTSGAVIPGFKKLSSLSLEPEDAITLRSRVIRFKYLTDHEQFEPDSTFQTLQQLVGRLSVPDASEKDLFDVLKALAGLFDSPYTSVSSFELIQSGLVDGLLHFAVDPRHTVCIKRREELIIDAFTVRRISASASLQSSFATLVKKLQESLTRMESFEVVTVAQGGDDSKRSSPSLLARQLRLRLNTGDESDIPRNLHSMVISIHAIATFQALHDYLRPRISGVSPGSRSPGMLPTLAASGFTSGSSSRNAGGEPPLVPAQNVALDAVEHSSEPMASTAAIGRRRSLRLSAKHSGTPVGATPASSTNESARVSSPERFATQSPDPTVPTEAALSDTVVESELQADFTDDEVEAEVLNEDPDPDTSVSEKTVTLSVVEDGSKVEAQTSDGIRIATPNALPVATSQPPSKASYAATLKAKPTDWHLEFSMDGHFLPLDLTIYGAIHQHEMRKKSGVLPQSMIWQGVYNVTFKKVPGPLPSPETRVDGAEYGSRGRPASPTVSSLPEDAPHAKILRLLRVLHKLNSLENERSLFDRQKRDIPESAFVNNKLTAKLTRQLEEPMIVASSCLPDWALDLPQHFPFLFPFSTRYSFLQSTSFGYARLISKWQSQQGRGQDNLRRDEGIGFLGRLQRQKVRISRKHILESAVKVFELYGSSSSILEVEYFEEAGTGLGPTLEFYSLVSKEFARRDLKIWRDADSEYPGLYVHHPTGLYPAPVSPDDIANDGGQKRTHIFRVIGQFVAKAMLDSRIIDLSFNKIFVKLILGEDVPRTLATLKLVDIDLANSLAKLQDLTLTCNQKNSVRIEDLALDFTVPGYNLELRPGGRDISVTSTNVHDYVHEVVDAIVGKGAQLQAKAFREGFSKVFPIQELQAFSADELVMLFGNSDEDWSSETLSEALKADHGFNAESRAIRDLVEIMSEYDVSSRRHYLQFITGSPKLPIGGFRGLNPPLTVVRKPHETPLTADDYLPSVMTCVNYLKLPEYSSKAVMREKLSIAIREGVGSFHLS